jgi:hypothetical protein
VTAPLDLGALDRAVQHALATRDERALHVIGYGEIAPVLAWPDADGPWACKRLPVFDDGARFDAYRACFDDYVTMLEKRSVTVQETRLEPLAQANGRVVAYCVQPVLPPETLAPALLRRATPSRGRALIEIVADRIERVVGPDVGLDAQISNWAMANDDLVYIDLTTPLLRDGDGKDRLDTDLFMAALPASVRPFVRRFLLPGILDTYHSPRAVALDVTGNLRKERLDEWIPLTIEVMNTRLELDMTVDEVNRFYQRDARLWSFLQRLRRIDREWQHRVRRRAYPFLLPGRIDRRG